MLTKEKWMGMSIDEKYGLMKLARIPASRVAFNYGGWNERLWEALQEKLESGYKEWQLKLPA